MAAAPARARRTAPPAPSRRRRSSAPSAEQKFAARALARGSRCPYGFHFLVARFPGFRFAQSWALIDRMPQDSSSALALAEIQLDHAGLPARVASDVDCVAGAGPEQPPA